MASKTLLEASVQRPTAGLAIGCLGGLAACLAVVVVVNLFIGEAQLPREIRGTTPWFVLATVIMGGITGGLWWRNRMRLAVVEIDGKRYLEVHDPSEPMVLELPVRVEYGWNLEHMPNAGNMTRLTVGIYQDEQLQLSLSELWGTIYDPPPGWPKGAMVLRGPAKASYEAAGQSFVVQLVELLEE